MQKNTLATFCIVASQAISKGDVYEVVAHDASTPYTFAQVKSISAMQIVFVDLRSDNHAYLTWASHCFDGEDVVRIRRDNKAPHSAMFHRNGDVTIYKHRAGVPTLLLLVKQPTQPDTPDANPTIADAKAHKSQMHLL